MLQRLFISVLIILHFLSAADSCAASSPVVPIIRSVVCESPPVVDGKLDDVCWAQASQATEFLRWDNAKTIPEKTEIRICYDQQALYVAFYCYDTQPDKIKAMQKKRGGRIWQDDLVEVALDTYHAHEETYWFSMTAGGTQHDHFPGGSTTNVGWRGDWQGAAQIHETGWTAEFAIPWGILRFSKDTDVMGFGASRYLPRTDVWVNWPDLGSDWDAKRMADLVDLQLPALKMRPVILPHLLGASEQHDRRDLSVGLDVKQLFSSGLIGTFTYNPDFRTIEDDIESIDFSYTERYIEDRRPFFTEGGGYFPSSRMFYTRRIENVDTGVKLFGRVGKVQVGILDAVDFGQRNDLAGKVTYDVAEDLNIWTGGVHSTMFDSSNATAGFGARYNHSTTGGGATAQDLLSIEPSSVTREGMPGLPTLGNGRVQREGSIFGPRSRTWTMPTRVGPAMCPKKITGGSAPIPDTGGGSRRELSRISMAGFRSSAPRAGPIRCSTGEWGYGAASISTS